MSINSVLTRLRDAIERGKGCPAAPKVSISLEFAREIDEALVGMAQRQVTDDMLRPRFERECG